MYVLRQLIEDMRHFLLPSVSIFIFFAHDKRFAIQVSIIGRLSKLNLPMLINPKFEGFSFDDTPHDNPNGYQQLNFCLLFQAHYSLLF